MPVKTPVYLDHHATTPVDPRVLDAMLPYFGQRFGNAASRTHAFGWEAEQAVEAARRQVAACIGAASPDEVVFTSGATESNNLAIKGIAEAARGRGRGDHVVTTAIEHRAVLDPCRHLEREGVRVTIVDVGRSGVVDPDDVARAITKETVLVSVMLANNEVGTIQPVAEIASLCRARGVAFHTDAAQAIGRVPLDVEAIGVDLASLSAHKIYGPKGVGALYVRRSGQKIGLVAQMDGGGHERGLRSGTLNVPGIVGLGAACELMAREGEAEAHVMLGLRNRLHKRLGTAEGVQLNGNSQARLPGSLNVTFFGVSSEVLLERLQADVALSIGSSCTSASLEPSYVLRAMGYDEERALGAIRFGIGRFNTEEEVDYVAERVLAEVGALRRASD